jgi:hypothetical protein
MDSRVIIRSDLKQKIGIRQLLLLHGELLNILEFDLVYQMLELLFKGLWIMPLGG